MIRPPLLKPGATVGILSPSRQIEKEQISKAVRVLESWGLKLKLGQYIYSKDGYFAGTDEERLQDLVSFLKDESIQAIFCSRGGYGMSRIIDDIHLQEASNPKWIVGFSDITCLHLACHKSGWESIHGLMPVQYAKADTEHSIQSLKTLLFEPKFKYELQGNNKCYSGRADGELIGGNLSLLTDSLGTQTEIDTDGKILFIEEIDEYYYKIDRMLNQLDRSGKFQNIKGLLVGQFSELKDTQIPFGKTFNQIIERYVGHLNIPVVMNFPAGHDLPNLALPLGRKVNLEVSQDLILLMG